MGDRPAGVIERLTLRPFQADDLPEFVAYRSDPEVARYQLWDSTYSLADAERFLSSQQGVRGFAVSSPENPTAELVSVLCPLQRLL